MTELDWAGDKLARAFDAFLERHTPVRFDTKPPDVPAPMVEVRHSVLALLVAGLDTFVALLRAAPAGTPLRSFLAETLRRMPTSPSERVNVDATVDGLWKRFPNSILDGPCSEHARLLEIASATLGRRLSEPAWRRHRFPEKQCRLLDALHEKGDVSEVTLIEAVYGDKEPGSKQPMKSPPKKSAQSATEKRIKARFRRLMKDTNNNLCTHRLPYEITRCTSRKTGIPSTLTLISV